MITDIMLLFIGGLMSTVFGIGTYSIKQQLIKIEAERDTAKKEIEATDKAISDGLKTLLESQLHTLYDRSMECVGITQANYLLWSKLYASYIALGGNSIVKHMNEDVNELPYCKPARPNKADRYAEQNIKQYEETGGKVYAKANNQAMVDCGRYKSN